MSHQYQPTSYYSWPDREHGIFLNDGKYTYVPYDYYAGDEIHNQNIVYRDSQYVTHDNTHARFLNLSDIYMYDTSGIKIHDSGTLTLYTSASPAARKYVVDEYGRVGIGMDHLGPHSNVGESPSFDLDVKGQIGTEDYIYHNDNTSTYMLFGSDRVEHNVNTDGSINAIYPTDTNEINFFAGDVAMVQMKTRDDSNLRITCPPAILDGDGPHNYGNPIDEDFLFGIATTLGYFGIRVTDDPALDGKLHMPDGENEDPNHITLYVDTSVSQREQYLALHEKIKDVWNDPASNSDFTYDFTAIGEMKHHVVKDSSILEVIFTDTYPEGGSVILAIVRCMTEFQPGAVAYDLGGFESNDHVTINKYQVDVDFIARSRTNTAAFIVSGDGSEVVVNNDGNSDTDFRVAAASEQNMLFVDTSHNRVSIGDSEDTPQATLEVTNDPAFGAFDVPLVQLNSRDTDKQALDINADNIDAHVISVSAEDLTVSNMFDSRNLNSLTTGRIINLHTNSPSSDERTLIAVHNQHVDAEKVRMLDIDQNAISDGRETALIRTSAPDSNPLLELRNSNDAQDTPPLLNFKALKPQSANVDLGTITFEGESNNAGSPSIVYAALSARATDVEFNKFGGVLNFMVQATDSPAQLRNMLSIGGQTNDDDGVETQAEVVINEDQIDLDLRVETDITDNAFIVYGDGSEVVVNENGVDTDFRVEAHGLDPTQFTKDDGSHDDTFETHYSAKKTHALYVNAENGRVGIGHDTPQTTLHVAGSAHIEGDLWVKGVTNQLDTMVHVTSAMDIHNIGTGPTLTVTQSGAQPVATFWDMDHQDKLQPALYLADKTRAGFGTVPTAPLHLSDTVQNQAEGTEWSTFLLEHNYNHGGMTINNTLGDKQSHLRFSVEGEYKWQLRCPLHADDECGRHTIRMHSRIYNGDVMTWRNNGHVGIGKENTCPDTFLSVKEDMGDFDIRNFTAADLNTIPLKLTDTSLNNNAYMTTAGLRFGYNGEEAPTIVGYDSGSAGQAGMAFITGSITSSSPRLATNMVINANGHVGIGRTDPSHRLSIYLGNDTTNPGSALRVVRDYTPVTANSTNHKKVSYISSSQSPIAAGVRDQGYRIALDASMYISDTDFKGTLDDARGVWARVGTYEHSDADRKPTGTIKKSYGIVVNNLRASDTTIEEQYGVYQHGSLPSGTDKDEVSNYFEGPLRIGGEAMNDKHAKLSVRTDKGCSTQRALEVEGPDPNIWFADTTSNNDEKDDYCIKWNGNYETGGALGFHRDCDWSPSDSTKPAQLMIDADKGNVAINNSKAFTRLYIESVDGLRIPVGTTAERPKPSAFGITLTDDDPANFPTGIAQSKPMLGTIRYNTTQSTFEGFGPGNTWGSLGGVIDVDRDTYWTAVNDLSNIHEDEFDSPTAYNDYPGDTDYLRAFTAGLKRFAIASDGSVGFYRKTGGSGTTSSKYTYNKYLKITSNSGNDALISCAGGSIDLSVAANHKVDISSHNGVNTGLSLGGTLVKSTASEINQLDLHTAANTSATITDDDTMVLIDKTTNGQGTCQVTMDKVRTFMQGNLTKNRALISDNNGQMAASVVTSTELARLSTALAGSTVNSKAAIYSATGMLPATSLQVNSPTAPAGTWNFGAGGNGYFTGDLYVKTGSDERLKDDITPISDPIEKLSKIGGYKFKWNDKSTSYTGEDYGVIAQEVEQIMPEIVEERESGYKALSYDRLIPLLVECVKNQQKQIDELKQQIDSK